MNAPPPGPRQPPLGLLCVSGTGTGVGKTIVTAAIAALARDSGASVAVVKPVQTGAGPGERADLAQVEELSGVTDLHEPVRLEHPLSPEAAARRADLAAARTAELAGAVLALRDRDLVIVEGAGGLLVRFNDIGETFADLAAHLSCPVVVVADPELGTLNHTALTLDAMRVRGLPSAGVVLGSWPAEPGLAARENVRDLTSLGTGPLAGWMPAGAAELSRAEFLRAARTGLGAGLGGTYSGGMP